ncbi:MAG TPA: hypothetical protein VE944_19325 [Nostoc sp.]|nr:hypothetical protein [Nostoc sp.]HYX16474.1 hypothetical protein [Nostoc sp.]
MKNIRTSIAILALIVAVVANAGICHRGESRQGCECNETANH